MSLEKELQRVMDMQNPWDEAKKKLLETWCIVNGAPFYLRDFSSMSTVEGKFSGVDKQAEITVETLEVFLPESGLYPTTKGNACLVIKKPKRQWQKSFNENFYTVMMIGNVGTQPKNYIEEIAKSKRVDIFKDKSGDIYYWETKIGRVEKNTLICFDKNFEQELKDWRRDGGNIHI
jgi:hypothetical protein